MPNIDCFFSGYINVMSDRSRYKEKKRKEREVEYNPRPPKPSPRSDRIEPPQPDMMEYQAEPREYQAQRYLFQPSLHTDQLHDQNHFDDVSIVDPRQNHHRQSFHQQRSEVNYMFYRIYLCKTCLNFNPILFLLLIFDIHSQMEHVYANHVGGMGAQQHRRRSIGGSGQFYYQNQDFFSTTINESSGGEDHNQSREENILNNSRNIPPGFDYPRNRPPEFQLSSNSSREWDQDFTLHSHAFRKVSLS